MRDELLSSISFATGSSLPEASVGPEREQRRPQLDALLVASGGGDLIGGDADAVQL